MSETFVVHIVFNLSEHGFRFYASLPSVFQSFLRAEQFFGSPLVLSKPMIQFYRPVSFCFKTAASQGTAFTPDSSVPCIFVDISGCGFHIPGAYPPHPLPHRADAEVMFFIVVEVFGLERVRFESRPLLHVEIVVLYVGFHAVFGHEAVILFGAIAGISNHRMGHPVIPVKLSKLLGMKYYVIYMNGSLKVVPKRTIRELVAKHRFRKGVKVADIERRAIYVTH